MLPVKPRRHAYPAGVVWPDTGTDTPINVRDVFGGRPFPAHVPTVGYNYDHHRGVDVPLVEGRSYLSPAGGRVSRLNRSHFPFNTDRYQAYWTVDNDGHGSSWDFASPGLTLTSNRAGANAWPSVDKYIATGQGVTMEAGQWELRVKLEDSHPAINGAFGIGLYDTISGERATMEWDGANVRCLGTSSSGNLSNHNSTNTVTAGHYWLRVRSSGTSLQMATSADGESWTNKFTETNPTWTHGDRPSWRAVVYYRSLDTNATDDVVNIEMVGWYDSNTIPRFGNWLTISGDTGKYMSMHFDDLLVEQGDYVEPGQELGTVGLTGFDDRSGPIVSPHVHVEYAPTADALYNNDESVNPLAAGILPRANVSSNVSVVVTSDVDPDGTDSHKLVVTCTREDQDFDMNEFSLTGNTNTRTINWDTRSGLNADNDIPKNNGVYLVASSFDESSSAYTITLYFNKSTVGSTLVSAYIKDCNGVTLWSI